VNGRIFDSVSIHPQFHVDPRLDVKYIPASIGPALGYRVEPFDSELDPAWLLMVPDFEGETPAVRVFSHHGGPLDENPGVRIEL